MSTEAPARPQMVAALPFVSGAHEHTEPAFTATYTPGTTVQRLNPTDIPAYGYIKHLILDVSCSGGAGGTLAADAPWNMLTDITLQDVNGAQIVGPINGYELYIANLVGAWAGVRPSMTDSPEYVGSAPNPSFMLRVPVEITSKDALGALSNQNSSANYKLTFGINTLANIFSVAPTTAPTVTVRCHLEAWTLPADRDSRGNPQAQVPPLLGTGQYISVQGPRATVVNGFEFPFTRLGQYLRFMAFIGRNGSGNRDDSVFPDPIVFEWDGMQIHNMTQRLATRRWFERCVGPFGRPIGVHVLAWNYGGEFPGLGNEQPTGWLPSTQSSRMVLKGSGNGTAGSVTAVTCEVAPVEVSQADRYEVPNRTGAAPVA
jgi:hypothetical protein